MLVTGVRLSDHSPDEGLGSSIAAPRGSLRSSLSRQIESNDTGRSIDVIEGIETDRAEGSDADRTADACEGADADLGADATVDMATAAEATSQQDPDAVPDAEGFYFIDFAEVVRR